MLYYKGFDKDLKCRDFQFEVGKEYEEKDAKLCNKGFHACENPLDVFGYYPPSNSRYCEVEMEDVSGERSDDSKVCAKKIKIGEEIGIVGIVNGFVKFVFEKVDFVNALETNTGYRSAATNTGDQSAATVEGIESVAIVTGIEGKAKGSLGCWIVVTERDKWNGKTYPIKSVKTAKVDGKEIKENTFYMLVNGKFKEVE